MAFANGAVGSYDDDWRAHLRNHQQSIGLALMSENVSYASLHSIVLLQDTPDPSLALKAAGAQDDVDQELKKINVDTAQAQQDSFDDLKKEAENLKNSGTSPNKEDWQKKLHSKRDELKQKASDTIDKAFSKAESYIDTLKPEMKSPAATVFNLGADWVAKAFQYVWQKAQEVVQAVGEFFKGVWSTLTNAYESVKGFVSTAIDAIKGIFGYAASYQLPPDSGLYESSITWKDSPSLLQAASTVEANCELLSMVNEMTGVEVEYSIVRSSATQTKGQSTGYVLFHVGKLANKLGQNWQGLFGKRDADVTATWTPRGVLDSSSSTPQAPVSKTTKTAFKLSWFKHKYTEGQVQKMLDDAKNAISEKLDGKYIVETEEIPEKTGTFHMVKLTCLDIPDQDKDAIDESIQQTLELEKKIEKKKSKIPEDTQDSWFYTPVKETEA